LGALTYSSYTTSVIALRKKAIFFPANFPAIFQSCFYAIFFVLRFNGGDQVEMKMIGKTDLVPDMHCLVIITEILLAFHLKVKHINKVT